MSRRRGLAALLALSVLALVGLRFTEPIPDGDLFFHLAYARQMLERGTLVPDHTAFSWTPTSNAVVYCTWASELVLYALWQALGFTGLFLFRYALVLGLLALAWDYARRVGLGTSPFAYLVLVIMALASYTGTMIKPEMFSLLGMNLVVWAVFRAKLAHARGRDPVRWLYLVPLVILVWVNAHGGFILAAPFLALVAVGEVFNLVWSPGAAFPRRVVGHLLASVTLSGLAVLATPYGYRYPRALIDEFVLGRTERPDVAWNAAFQPTLAAGARAFHFEELLVLMVLPLAALLWLRARGGPARGRVDWTIVLANLAYLAIYVTYVRSTFFWAPVFAYSALWLAHAVTTAPAGRLPWSRRPWIARALAETAIAFALFLAGRASYEAWARPFTASWLGWGVSYVSPVAETEFLAAQRLGPRLYNIFDSGGYLLWRLDPAYKVMVDSRSFPYLAWFRDQERFTRGQIFDEFLAKYPGPDVAIIDLAKADCARNFARAPGWRLAFYGPTAAVFVRAGVVLPESARTFAPDRLRELKNAATALQVFDFAASAGDQAAAWQVLAQLETRLRHQVEPLSLRRAQAYREAHRALRAGDYPGARARFGEVFAGGRPGERDARVLTLLDQRAALTTPSAEAARVEAALRELAGPE